MGGLDAVEVEARAVDDRGGGEVEPRLGGTGRPGARLTRVDPPQDRLERVRDEHAVPARDADVVGVRAGAEREPADERAVAGVEDVDPGLLSGRDPQPALAVRVEPVGVRAPVGQRRRQHPRRRVLQLAGEDRAVALAGDEVAVAALVVGDALRELRVGIGQHVAVRQRRPGLRERGCGEHGEQDGDNQANEHGASSRRRRTCLSYARGGERVRRVATMRIGVGERRARLARRHRLAPGCRAGGVEDAAESLVCLHGRIRRPSTCRPGRGSTG